MLNITIGPANGFNEKTNEFITIPEYHLTLEHSLVSVSKWEAIWHKSYLNHEKFTRKEFISYVKCMTITQNVPDIAYTILDYKTIEIIKQYIDNPMTATHFREDGTNKGKKQIITSEVIYYWMTAAQIPFSPTEKWHLNRLLTLIRVCNEKNNPKQQSTKDIYKQNAELNAARRAAKHSKG